MIKIFRMNDFDWFAAASLEDAKAAVKQEFGPPAEGQTDEEFFEEMLEEPHVLDDSELDALIFVEEEFEDDEDLDDTGHPRRNGGEKKTFRQKLAEMIAAGEKFPCLFATTEA